MAKQLKLISMSDLLSQIKSKVSDVRAEIWQLRLTLSDIDKALQDHRNPYDHMVAARDQVDAAKVILTELENFLSTNKASLDTNDLAYGKGMLSTLGSILSNYDRDIVLPTISPAQIEAQKIEGTVISVEDGDTYDIRDENGNVHKVRMAGVDSPENGNGVDAVTTNGRVSQKGLQDMILNKKIITFVDKHNPLDMYRRVLGTPVANGKNITMEMVARCLSKRNNKFGKNVFVDQDELEVAGINCVTFPGWGILHVYSRPTNAAIWIDGEDVGVVAPDKIPLPIGDHEISVMFPGKATKIETRYIGPGETQVRFDLEDNPASTFNLKVKPIDPRHPRVFVDSVDQGYAPMIIGLESDVKHSVILEAEGYEPYEEEVSAKAYDEVTIEVELQESK
jgi:endonuclease YncB( thermonuclease family)